MIKPKAVTNAKKPHVNPPGKAQEEAFSFCRIHSFDIVYTQTITQLYEYEIFDIKRATPLEVEEIYFTARHDSAATVVFKYTFEKCHEDFLVYGTLENNPDQLDVEMLQYIKWELQRKLWDYVKLYIPQVHFILVGFIEKACLEPEE